MKNDSKISFSNNVGSDQHITSKSLVIATCFVILLIGLSGWFFTNVVVRYGTNNERRNFLSRAETAASTFSPTFFEKLSGKPEDVKTDNHTLILAQLIRIRDINKDVRFDYLMRIEEQKKQLFMVKSSDDHLLSLVHDILDIAEIEAGRAKLSPEEFELDALIGELEKSLSSAAKAKGLELITDVPKSVTKKPVWGCISPGSWPIY